MNGSRGYKSCRILAMTAVLFGAMVTTLALPAYGQQEVAPTWYDPWAAPNTVVVHSSQSRSARHPHQRAVRSGSTAPSAAKLRGKQLATRPRSS